MRPGGKAAGWKQTAAGNGKSGRTHTHNTLVRACKHGGTGVGLCGRRRVDDDELNDSYPLVVQ